MRVLLATAGGLALMASGAAADTETVTLTATVGDFIEITSATGSTIGDLDITQGSTSDDNNNSGQGASTKALFEVTSNVDYNIALDWETWQEAGLTIPSGVPASFEQANYANSDAGCSIGGIVSLDTDPSTATNAVVRRPSGGVTPLTPADVFTPGVSEYGVNTEAAPTVTNCPGDVAAPGDYSIDVEITVSKA
jgi:hypothetical protein